MFTAKLPVHPLSREAVFQLLSMDAFNEDIFRKDDFIVLQSFKKATLIFSISLGGVIYCVS